MAEWLALTQVAERSCARRVVAVQADGELDHAAWRLGVDAWRRAFSARNGTRWAMHFENTVAFSQALFGAWHAGKVVYLCADLLPETLARLTQCVDGFVGDFPAQHAVLRPDALASDTELAWPPLAEDAPCLVLYTSGSTGEAAPVVKRLAQLAREVEALQAQFGAALADVEVHGTVSHQHIYGLLFRVLWPLAAGMPIAPRQFFHEEIAATLRRPAILISSPAHLKRIPETVDWQDANPHLRAVFSSGGALPEEAAVDVRERLRQPVTELYGSTETGGIAWRRRDRPEPSWQALNRVAWRLVEGQLELSSPHLAETGWWRSADRAVATSDGGFRLLGRSDRIVKVEERRVSLGLLEEALKAQPEVSEARVLLLEGARSSLAAVVVLSALGCERQAQEGVRAVGLALGRAIAGEADAVLRPRRWRFVTELPMNAQGKVTEAALRALFRRMRPQAQWQHCGPDAACAQLKIDADLAVFDGHFPQYPILPGVAQVDWAVQCAREVFALNGRAFLRLEALKFQRVVRPGATITLQLNWSAEHARLGFSYHSEHGAHASGRVVFAEAMA
jgi:acyl-CoA synthetase (AMP-forming)/AMP-acid ligase II/3-hydroxymyristoyl/3-hydroxydecanoyl-(acyl carrier protein) dehydratase